MKKNIGIFNCPANGGPSKSWRGQDLLHTRCQTRLIGSSGPSLTTVSPVSDSKLWKIVQGNSWSILSGEYARRRHKRSLPSSYANNPGQQQILSRSPLLSRPGKSHQGCRRSLTYHVGGTTNQISSCSNFRS